MNRCRWISGKPDYYVKYHDNVWGKPEHRDLALFRWLILEMFHVGLSWQLILSKQEAFNNAFDDFDYLKVAAYDDEKISQLMLDAGIIRHQKKIEAAINNARAFIKVQNEFGSFNHYLWAFTNGQSIVKKSNEIEVTHSELSDLITKDLKQRGFKFIGSVTIYSYLQAVGIINDHDLDCDFR